MRKTEIMIADDVARNRVIDFIKNLAPDKKWIVTVQKYRKQRSLPQNRLLHKWLGIIADETGDTPSSTKEDMIDAFAPDVESKIKPGTFRKKRTHEMDTAEMTDFYNRIYQLACEFNIWLPHPDDQGRE